MLSSISFISVLFTVFQVQVFFSPEFSLLTDFIFDENINDIVVFLSEIPQSQLFGHVGILFKISFDVIPEVMVV